MKSRVSFFFREMKFRAKGAVVCPSESAQVRLISELE